MMKTTEPMTLENEPAGKDVSVSQIRSHIRDLVMKAPKSDQIYLYGLLHEFASEDQEEQSWDEFVAHFDRTHHDFIMNLFENYDTLTTTELKVCAYMKIGKSNVDISTMLGVAIDVVEVIRREISEKILLDSDASLVQRLVNS